MENKVMWALHNLMTTSGKNAKELILKQNADLPGFKEVMQFIYDPYVRTGIARAKLSKAHLIPNQDYSLVDIIAHFKKNQTGSNADANIARTFMNKFKDEPIFEDIAAGIVTKSLKTGVTAKTLNKVYGADFIPLIGIMRGKDYQDYKDKVKGPFIATEKIDGIRRLIIKEDGKISMYSRSGIPDDGLVDIIKEAEHLPNNCVFDGELEAKGEYENALALRQATASIANSKGNRTGLNIKLFDMMPLAEYKRGKSSHDAIIRKTLLGAMFGDESIECLAPTMYKDFIAEHKIAYDFEHIAVVPIEGIVRTEEDIISLAEPVWRRGGEGLMLNVMNSKYDYTVTQSSQLLKVKATEEFIGQVIGVEIGRPGTVNENRLGALQVQVMLPDGTFVETGVGSGLDSSMRDLWWDNPELIIGQSIELESFGVSTNKQGGRSINCPIFKRVVGEE